MLPEEVRTTPPEPTPDMNHPSLEDKLPDDPSADSENGACEYVLCTCVCILMWISVCTCVCVSMCGLFTWGEREGGRGMGRGEEGGLGGEEEGGVGRRRKECLLGQWVALVKTFIWYVGQLFVITHFRSAPPDNGGPTKVTQL